MTPPKRQPESRWPLGSPGERLADGHDDAAPIAFAGGALHLARHDKANDDAIDKVGVPDAKLIERTRPQLPHNKFIIWLDEDENPISVWTGSVNFTPSGFLGQTNVGHLITDDSGKPSAIPSKYYEYWKVLSGKPTASPLAKRRYA